MSYFSFHHPIYRHNQKLLNKRVIFDASINLHVPSLVSSFKLVIKRTFFTLSRESHGISCEIENFHVKTRTQKWTLKKCPKKRTEKNHFNCNSRPTRFLKMPTDYVENKRFFFVFSLALKSCLEKQQTSVDTKTNRGVRLHLISTVNLLAFQIIKWQNQFAVN